MGFNPIPLAVGRGGGGKIILSNSTPSAKKIRIRECIIIGRILINMI